MKSASTLAAPGRLVLYAETAADVMTPNPQSLRQDATVKEALALLADRAVSGAPVIDASGKPVGVLSSTDIVIHEREKGEHTTAPTKRSQAGEPASDGTEGASTDPAQVRDLMTPIVFSVTPDTPVAEVVKNMLEMKVHRLFVVDATGVLIGVISSQDLLRRLQPEPPGHGRPV